LEALVDEDSASIRDDATSGSGARSVTSKPWHGWVTILAGVAIALVVTNIVLFERNRTLQAEVAARTQYLQQTAQIEALNREIVNALANLAVRNQDEALKAILTEQGININMGPGQGAPAPGPAPESKSGR
jgi:LPS O-antigen subunit length determinant protein (WzzB/FepE family)